MEKNKKTLPSVASQWLRALLVVVPIALLTGLLAHQQLQNTQQFFAKSIATNGKQNGQKVTTDKQEDKQSSSSSTKGADKQTTSTQRSTQTTTQNQAVSNQNQVAQTNQDTAKQSGNVSTDEVLNLVDERTSVTIVNNQNELNANVADSNAPNASSETVTLTPSATYDAQSTFDKATSQSQSITTDETTQKGLVVEAKGSKNSEVTTNKSSEEQSASETFDKIQTIFADKTPLASDVEKGEVLKAVPGLYHQISTNDQKNGQLWKFNLALSDNRFAQIAVDTRNNQNGSSVAEKNAAQIFKQFGQNLKAGSFDEAVDNYLLQNSQVYKNYVAQSDAQAESGKDISFADIVPNLADHINISAEAPTNGEDIIDLPAASIKDPKQALEELKKQKQSNDNKNNDDSQNQLVRLKELLDAKLTDATEYEKGEIFKSLPTVIQYIHDHSSQKDAGRIWNFRLPTTEGRDLFITINGKSDFQNSDFNEQHFTQILYGLGDSLKTGAFDDFVDNQILLNSKEYAGYKKQTESQQSSPLNPLMLLLGLLALPVAGLLLLAAPVLLGLATLALIAIPLIAIPLMVIGLGLSLLSIPFFIGATILGVIGGVALAAAVILGIIIPIIGLPIALVLGAIGLIASGIGLITLLIGLAIAGISALLIIPALLAGLFFAAWMVLNFLVSLAIFAAVALGFFLIFILPALINGFLALIAALVITIVTALLAIFLANPLTWLILGLSAVLAAIFFFIYTINSFILGAIIIPWIFAIIPILTMIVDVIVMIIAAIVLSPIIIFTLGLGMPIYVILLALIGTVVAYLGYIVLAVVFGFGLVILDLFAYVLIRAAIGIALFVGILALVTFLNPIAAWILWAFFAIVGPFLALAFIPGLIGILISILLTIFPGSFLIAAVIGIIAVIVGFIPVLNLLAPLLVLIAVLAVPFIGGILFVLALNVFAFLLGIGVAGIAYGIIATLGLIALLIWTPIWIFLVFAFLIVGLPAALSAIAILLITAITAFAIATIFEAIKLLLVLPILALLLFLNPLNWILPLLALIIPLLPWLGLLIGLLPIIAGALILGFGLFNLALSAFAFIISLISGLIGWLIALPIALITLTLSLISTLIAIGLLLTGLTLLVIGAILIPVLLIKAFVLKTLALLSLLSGIALSALSLLGIATAINNMSKKVKQVTLPDWDTTINVPEELDKKLTVIFVNNTSHNIKLSSGAVVKANGTYTVSDWQSDLGVNDESSDQELLQAWINMFNLDGDTWNLNLA